MIRLIPLGLLLAINASPQTAAREDERKSGFVNVPGGPVWYEIMGHGDGIPLVTLHGGPGGTSCGLQVLAPLGDDRIVVRYDQLGSGRSGRPNNHTLWRRDRFVEELDALRNALGLKEIHLHGHSWGGALAAYYVLETGGKGVKSLTLSSPLISTKDWIKDTNLLRKQLPEAVQETMAFHERNGSTDSDEYRATEAVFNDHFVTRGEAKETYSCPNAPRNSGIYEQMWGPTEFHATGSLVDFDISNRLKDLVIPTLFVTGEFDEARPETVESYAKHVMGSQFVVIKGVAHASSSRAPTEYRNILRSFIENVENR